MNLFYEVCVKVAKYYRVMLGVVVDVHLKPRKPLRLTYGAEALTSCMPYTIISSFSHFASSERTESRQNAGSAKVGNDR